MNSGMEINNIVVAAVERLIDSVSSLPHLGQNGANLTDGRLIIELTSRALATLFATMLPVHLQRSFSFINKWFKIECVKSN